MVPKIEHLLSLVTQLLENRLLEKVHLPWISLSDKEWGLISLPDKKKNHWVILLLSVYSSEIEKILE